LFVDFLRILHLPKVAEFAFYFPLKCFFMRYTKTFHFVAITAEERHNNEKKIQNKTALTHRKRQYPWEIRLDF